MFSIRPAAASDHDAIWGILEPVLRAGETYALPRDIGRDDALAYWLAPANEVFVAQNAESGGRILGTYVLRANQSGGGSHVANCGYMTAADAQGRGVARAMLEHSLDRARTRGFRAMQFNFVVGTNERAIKTWRAYGFEIAGRLPAAFNHPRHGYVDALVMYKPLTNGPAPSGVERPAPAALRSQFGDIDIYLFDQLLRGRVAREARIVDAGCGGGRNLVYLLQAGYDVYGVDADPAAIAAVRRMAPDVNVNVDAAERFRAEPVEAMTFPDAFADVVISSAVLHFSRDEQQFDAMVASMWRVLKPGGMLFARLASTIGIEERVRPLGNSRFLLPDGSERYLVDEATLMAVTRRLGGSLLDPLKTTVVQDQRSMTTWVIGKDLVIG